MFYKIIEKDADWHIYGSGVGDGKKEFKKFFDKAIYFPFPDYSTRRLMWKTFIEELGGVLRPDFPLSTLAHISHGYSAGSLKKSVESVLTKYRKLSVSYN